MQYAGNPSYSPSGMPPLTKGVKWLLVVTFAAYVLELLPYVGQWLLGYGELVPVLAFAHGQVWRLATYLFLHSPSLANPWHVLFNMLALWMFGIELEQRWGAKGFVWFYLLSGVGSAVFSVFMWRSPIIGASGAILALLTVYAFYFPERTILMFFIFPMPVRWAVVAIGVISLIGSVGGAGGIAHLTHLGGIAVGIAFVKMTVPVQQWAWRARARQMKRSEKKLREETVSRERLYRERIDPILKKISRSGMDSLTAEERRVLADASKKPSP